jgi:hypothetical protein
MVAGRKEDMRDGGRGGGRGEAVRQSRRSRGLPPEEQKDLEEVIRETRVAKLKAVQEEKERSSAEDQPAPEPAVQDAHQVSKDGDSESRPPRPEAVEGESVQDEPTQASKGDADPEVPPKEDRVSDSPPPDQDVGPLEDIPAAADESSLTTVQEDEVLEDLKVSSHPETKIAAAKAAQTIESKPASMMAVQDARPGRAVEVAVQDALTPEQAAKAYVA